jgi:hypothetical protein
LLFINIFNLQRLFYYRLRLLDVSRAQWSFLLRRTYGVKTAKKGCNSSSTTTLNTLWYVCSTIFFRKLLFSWIEFDVFFFNFQETYNSWLRERYRDDPSTHSDFNPDLWMEARSSGRPEKNWVYELFNTTAENLRVIHSVSTNGSSNRYQGPSLRSLWPCNNTRLISLKNMSDSRLIMNNSAKWSWTWDHRWVVRVRPFFGRMVLGTTSLLLLILLQHLHCSSLILIWTNKIVMNIWILYYSSLFLHISILYNFIFLFFYYYYYSKQFYINYFMQF